MIETSSLGKLVIKANGQIVSDQMKQSSKVWQLLNLLIINRNKPISTAVLCEAIWDDDYEGDTSKAVQNLIYRLRRMLMNNDCVIYKNKTYMLNPETEWHIDVYELEDNFQKSQNASLSPQKKIEILNQIIALYNGEYMLQLFCNETQTYVAVNRYKRMYIESVCMLTDLYGEQKEYDKVYTICEKAIELEPMEEPLYIRIAESMRQANKTAQALKLLDFYFDSLQRKMGITASDAIIGLYTELNKELTHSKRRIPF